MAVYLMKKETRERQRMQFNQHNYPLLLHSCNECCCKLWCKFPIHQILTDRKIIFIHMHICARSHTALSQSPRVAVISQGSSRQTRIAGINSVAWVTRLWTRSSTLVQQHSTASLQEQSGPNANGPRSDAVRSWVREQRAFFFLGGSKTETQIGVKDLEGQSGGRQKQMRCFPGEETQQFYITTNVQQWSSAIFPLAALFTALPGSTHTRWGFRTEGLQLLLEGPNLKVSSQ